MGLEELRVKMRFNWSMKKSFVNALQIFSTTHNYKMFYTATKDVMSQRFSF